MAKHLDPLQKEYIVQLYKRSRDVKLKEFCRIQQVTEVSLKKWIALYEKEGLRALCRANSNGTGPYPPELDFPPEELRRENMRLRIEKNV